MAFVYVLAPCCLFPSGEICIFDLVTGNQAVLARFGRNSSLNVFLWFYRIPFDILIFYPADQAFCVSRTVNLHTHTHNIFLEN
jgi:hypothetical protein